MKKIEAIIRKSKYSEVKEALHAVGVNFFSYWDVTGLSSFNSVFSGATSFNGDVSNWDTSNASSFYRLFKSNTVLTPAGILYEYSKGNVEDNPPSNHLNILDSIPGSSVVNDCYTFPLCGNC